MERSYIAITTGFQWEYLTRWLLPRYTKQEEKASATESSTPILADTRHVKRTSQQPSLRHDIAVGMPACLLIHNDHKAITAQLSIETQEKTVSVQTTLALRDVVLSQFLIPLPPAVHFTHTRTPSMPLASCRLPGHLSAAPEPTPRPLPWAQREPEQPLA